MKVTDGGFIEVHTDNNLTMCLNVAYIMDYTGINDKQCVIRTVAAPNGIKINHTYSEVERAIIIASEKTRFNITRLVP